MATQNSTIKNFFTPFGNVSKRNLLILVAVEAALAIIAWQLAGKALIPPPLRVIESIKAIVSSRVFYDNFFSSLGLILEGMGISILIAMAISYLAVIPVFIPIARFIMKCRYLTLTGLIFLFTLLTNDGHQLKISLLIFGIVPFFTTSLLSIIAAIPVQEYELCKSLRMSDWEAWTEVVILGRLDQVLEVLRQNFAIAWMMITMVEGLSMSEGGLGTMLIKSNKYIDMGSVFGLLIIIFLIGILTDMLLAAARTWLFPYTKFNTNKR